MAYALDFINDKQQFPDGFKTIVGEYGVKLSGKHVSVPRAQLSASPPPLRARAFLPPVLAWFPLVLQGLTHFRCA